MFDSNNLIAVTKHQRRFVALATTIFALVGIGHLLRVVYGLPLVIGTVAIPLSVSWFAVALALAMVVMGVAYLRK